MEKKYYVYVHKRKTDGLPFYIGKGCGSRHLSSHSRNDWWKSVVAKHGFVSEIIKENMSEKCAYTLEKILIFKLKKQGVMLSNIGSGGEGNPGDLSMNRKPVVCSNGMEFESVGAAASWAGISDTKISQVCRGSRHTSGGFTWAYRGNIPNEYVSGNERVSIARSKRVNCSNGMSFNSGKHACEWLLNELGMHADRANISYAANGKIKSAYGFSWWFDGHDPVPYISKGDRISTSLRSRNT